MLSVIELNITEYQYDFDKEWCKLEWSIYSTRPTGLMLTC